MNSAHDEQTHPYYRTPTATGRTLHLLDVENLVGDPCAGAGQVTQAIDAYRRAAGAREGDLAIIATNGRLALAAGLAWPGALLRIGRGRDGADLALLAEAVPAQLASRFARIFLGSGDGIFADTLRELRSLGRPVTVVARSGSVSASLRRVASVRYLGPTLTASVNSVGAIREAA